MDINVLRTVVTVVVFAAFIGIVCWAYAPLRRARFERDAMLPFDEANPAEHDGAQQLSSSRAVSGTSTSR